MSAQVRHPIAMLIAAPALLFVVIGELLTRIGMWLLDAAAKFDE